jgi:hypothetical protein
MSRRNRTSPSFNNGIPLGKLFSNTPYTIKTDVTKGGKRMHNSLYEQMRKLGQC